MDSDSDNDLPPAWEERATVDGNIYYVNHIIKSTQWIHPRTGKKKFVSRELPFGWKKIVDSSGRVTFHNEITDISTHSDPRLAFAIEVDKSNTDIRYKFDASSTALEVLHGIDLSNKVAVITGSNTGIGKRSIVMSNEVHNNMQIHLLSIDTTSFETAQSLALHGCTVILACRSASKAKLAIQKIQSQRSKAKCSFMKLDLASLNSVKQFVKQFEKKFKQLDILVLNAGVFAIPHTLTENGYESMFQICHLSHFYLTNLLEPMILQSLGARIVVVSSESHRFANLTRSNISESILSPSASNYNKLWAYNNAKLCNILFANELHAKWYVKGVNVYSIHPGNLVFTNLARHSFLCKILSYLGRPFTKSLQQAASTSVFCATYPSLSTVSGVYFNNCFPCIPSDCAKDSVLSRQLWQLSERMINEAHHLEDTST